MQNTTRAREVFPREAVACALRSIKDGVARLKPNRQELWDRAVALIRYERDHCVVDEGETDQDSSFRG